MANEKNLIPQAHTLTVEELSKGGLNSGKVRKQNKTVKEIFQKLLSCNLSVEDMQKVLRQYPGLDNDEINYKTAVGIKQLEKALKGDINSAKFMFDYAGEKPIEAMETEIKLPVFNIEVTDNKDLEKEFSKYETNTETN